MKREGFKQQLEHLLKMKGITMEKFLSELEISKERANELLEGNIPTVMELKKICLLTGTDVYNWLNVILNEKAGFITSKFSNLIESNNEEGIVDSFIFGKILLVHGVYYERFVQKINKIDNDTILKALRILAKHNIELAKKFSTKDVFLTYDDLKDYDLSEIYKYITYSTYSKKDTLTAQSITFIPFINSCPKNIKNDLLSLLYDDIKEFGYYIQDKKTSKFSSEEKIYEYYISNTPNNFMAVVDLNYDFSNIEECDEMLNKINDLLAKIECKIIEQSNA